MRFVVVPFLPAHQPALGVSSLLSVLEARGIAGDVRYLNLAYGERVGWDLYGYLTSLLPTFGNLPVRSLSLSRDGRCRGGRIHKLREL